MQIAIGDIHGCYRELMALMDKLPKDRQIIFLGDYMDRGPDSKLVVAQLMQWSKMYPDWVFLKGNHEDIFEDWYRGARKYGPYNWFANGGNTTYESYKPYKAEDPLQHSLQPAVFPEDHLEFLFTRDMYYETDDYFFVHAGVVPGSSLENQKELIGVPPSSVDNAFLWAREGFIDSDYDWGKKIIFGHTADYQGRYNKKRFEPIVMDNKIGIDTACCPPARNKLTAILLPEETFVFQDAII